MCFDKITITKNLNWKTLEEVDSMNKFILQLCRKCFSIAVYWPWYWHDFVAGLEINSNSQHCYGIQNFPIHSYFSKFMYVRLCWLSAFSNTEKKYDTTLKGNCVNRFFKCSLQLYGKETQLHTIQIQKTMLVHVW